MEMKKVMTSKQENYSQTAVYYIYRYISLYTAIEFCLFVHQ